MKKFVSIVFTSISLLALFAGAGHSSFNNNNESQEEYNARIALQQQVKIDDSSGSTPSQPSALSVAESAESSTEQGLSLVTQRIRSVPNRLSLRNSLQLQSVCGLFMTEAAATEINNVFTNFAYEQSLKLYAQHGDRFIEPLSEHIHGMVFGILESSVKKAIGVGDLFNAIKKLTGFNISGQKYATKAANKTLPKVVLNVLRLKFVTDLLNKHVVGPNLVAPNVASVVNQINFGKILQEELFGKLINLLKSFENELADQSVCELKAYANQVAALEKELKQVSESLSEVDVSEVNKENAEIEKLHKTARAGLSWADVVNPCRTSTEKELEVAKKREALAPRTEKINKTKHKINEFESKIKSLREEGKGIAYALIAVDRYKDYDNQMDLTENDIKSAKSSLISSFRPSDVFRDLPLIGASADSYMSPCPHIVSDSTSSLMTGENISLLAMIPRSYLCLTGVIGSVERLREDFSPQAFKCVFEETVNKINVAKANAYRLREVQLMPTQEQLEKERGQIDTPILRSIVDGLTITETLGKGGMELFSGVKETAEQALSIHLPARNHLNRIQTDTQRGILALNIAAAPVRLGYNFAVNAGQLWAVTYMFGCVNQLSSYIIGEPLTNFLPDIITGLPVINNLYLLAFGLGMLKEFYILAYHIILLYW